MGGGGDRRLQTQNKHDEQGQVDQGTGCEATLFGGCRLVITKFKQSHSVIGFKLSQLSREKPPQASVTADLRSHPKL